MAVQRIAFCHLESLTCLPAINRLFSDLGDRIGLVVVSRRFGPKHGNMLQQFVANVRRSGLPMTLALGFDLVSAQIVARIALGLALITRRRPFLETLPELARRSGANLVRTADINSESMAATLRDYRPDIIIVMNFDQILRSAVIATPTVGVINIHPSLLPDFRGPCPVFWALAENRKKSGVTLHLIKNTMIDAGPVLVSIERALDKSSLRRRNQLGTLRRWRGRSSTDNWAARSRGQRRAGGQGGLVSQFPREPGRCKAQTFRGGALAR